MKFSFSDHLNFLRFQIGRYKGYTLDSDSLDFHTSMENEYFIKRIQLADQYLEFGAGFSTIMAASNGVKTVTVESDPLFWGAVSEILCGKKIDHHVTPIIRQLGLLGPWGSPFISILSPVTKKRARRFREYSEPPWINNLGTGDTANPNITLQEGHLPDLVLIDGKFRVACALKLLEYFREHDHNEYEIMVDDYVGRVQYHVLGEFFEIGATMHELVTLHPKQKIDEKKLKRIIKYFELIPD